MNASHGVLPVTLLHTLRVRVGEVVAVTVCVSFQTDIVLLTETSFVSDVVEVGLGVADGVDDVVADAESEGDCRVFERARDFVSGRVVVIVKVSEIVWDFDGLDVFESDALKVSDELRGGSSVRDMLYVVLPVSFIVFVSLSDAASIVSLFVVDRLLVAHMLDVIDSVEVFSALLMDIVAENDSDEMNELLADNVMEAVRPSSVADKVVDGVGSSDFV